MTAYEPVGQVLGAYDHLVGDIRVTALNDGMFGADFAWVT